MATEKLITLNNLTSYYDKANTEIDNKILVATTDMATQTQVALDISMATQDMATQTWVNQQSFAPSSLENEVNDIRQDYLKKIDAESSYATKTELTAGLSSVQVNLGSANEGKFVLVGANGELVATEIIIGGSY